LTRRVLQSALEVEMAKHLGYDRYDPAGRGSDNSRNGSTPKTVRTDVGEVTINVPRDRGGTFEPQIVAKHQRRLAGFDEAVISLYAKGMTTGDIAAHLSEVYDTEVSRDLVSRVTEKVLADMRAWRSRPLDPAGLSGDLDRCDRAQGPGQRGLAVGGRHGGQSPGLRGNGHQPRW
jgi:transposase-like protein